MFFSPTPCTPITSSNPAELELLQVLQLIHQTGNPRHIERDDGDVG